MKLASQASTGATTADSGPGARLTRNTLTLGTLAVISCVTVVFLATNSSVSVNLFALAATAIFGLFAVRGRGRSQVARDALHEQFADTVAAVPVGDIQTPRLRRLRPLGGKLLERTRAQNQPLTVALFDFGDLPELQSLFAGEVAKDLGPTIAKKLKSIAPRRGIIVRMGPTAFMVLLPNFDATRTRAAITEKFGRGCCIDFADGNHEMLLVPDVLVQTVRQDTSSVQDLYQSLCSDLVRGQLQEERRLMHLKAERESHISKRAPVCPIDGAEIKKTREARLAPMAKTMPASLGMQ